MERRELVLMVHPGRCGSSVLGSLLHQHPDLQWTGELFRDESSRMRAGPALFEWLASAKLAPGKRLLGLEVKPWFSRFSGWPLEDLVQGLGQRFELRAIILWRRNLLRAVVSAGVAEARQTYHLYGGAQASLTTIRLDPAKVLYGGITCSLLEQLERLELHHGQAEQLLSPFEPLRLTYEDDVEGSPLAGYERIRRHLGLAPFSPKVRLSRTTPFPLSQVVENWDEIKQLLAGRRYQGFCEEP